MTLLIYLSCWVAFWGSRTVTRTWKRNEVETFDITSTRLEVAFERRLTAGGIRNILFSTVSSSMIKAAESRTTHRLIYTEASGTSNPAVTGNIIVSTVTASVWRPKEHLFLTILINGVFKIQRLITVRSTSRRHVNVGTYSAVEHLSAFVSTSVWQDSSLIKTTQVVSRDALDRRSGVLVLIFSEDIWETEAEIVRKEGVFWGILHERLIVPCWDSSRSVALVTVVAEVVQVPHPPSLERNVIKALNDFSAIGSTFFPIGYSYYRRSKRNRNTIKYVFQHRDTSS